MQMTWLVSEILLQGQTPGPPQGPWAWHYGMMGGGWGIFMMMISVVLFWGLIIGGVILLVRVFFPQSKISRLLIQGLYLRRHDVQHG